MHVPRNSDPQIHFPIDIIYIPAISPLPTFDITFYPLGLLQDKNTVHILKTFNLAETVIRTLGRKRKRLT